MLSFILSILFFFFVAYLWLRFRSSKLAGEDLRAYDATPKSFATAQPSEGLDRLNDFIHQMFISTSKEAKENNYAHQWVGKRERFDAMSLARDFAETEFVPDVITIDGREITGSWTLVPGYHANKRLLYMHGGAFTVGSDISHRPLTVQLARRTGMAVFAPNYRLMPENSRRDGIADAQASYDWIIENGPDGPAPAEKLVLSGDSAGGNLVLMLSNWARDTNNRRPDAVIALSPTVDATFSSPSLRNNISTDHMLRPMMKPVLKLPKLFLLPAMQHHYGMNPSDPKQSPIYSDLADLPPTLLQVSRDEMLYDDSVRFVEKAKSAGSPVDLQIWDGGLPHVWQIFDDYIPEAGDALKEIKLFLDKNI